MASSLFQPVKSGATSMTNWWRKKQGLPPMTLTQSPTEFGGLQPQKDKSGNVMETSGPQGYAQVPDYMELAKEYLPEPKPLAALESMPEYGKTQVNTNLQDRPEYGQASTWNLPTAPRLSKIQYVDPQAYENQWNLSSEALRKAYYGEGGENQRAVESILERGLGTSGDRGRVMGDVAENFARELANARTGLDISRMQGEADVNMRNVEAENALNQMLYGSEAARNQSVSGAARSLLGARLGQEQYNAGQAGNLLGQRAERDLYESQIPFQMGQARLGAATGLTQAQNEILGKVWEQEFSGKQFDFQKEIERRKAEEAMRAGRNEELMTIIGQLNLTDEEERQLVEWWAKQSGSPIGEFYPPGAFDSSQVPDRTQGPSPYGGYAREGVGRGIMSAPPGSGGKPMFAGAYIGENINGWVWSGEDWQTPGARS